MILIANQTKYGQIKKVDFTIEEKIEEKDIEINSMHNEEKHVEDLLEP